MQFCLVYKSCSAAETPLVAHLTAEQTITADHEAHEQLNTNTHT